MRKSLENDVVDETLRAQRARIMFNGYEPVGSVPPPPPPGVSGKAVGDEIGTFDFLKFQLRTAVYEKEIQAVFIQVEAFIVERSANGDEYWEPKDVAKVAKLDRNKMIRIHPKTAETRPLPRVTYYVPATDTEIVFVATFRYGGGSRRGDSKVTISRVIVKA